MFFNKSRDFIEETAVLEILTFGMHVADFLLEYVTGFARRGLIRAPLQYTDFTTIL